MSAQRQDQQWVIEALERMLDLARRHPILDGTELDQESDIIRTPPGDGVWTESHLSGIEIWTMRLVVNRSLSKAPPDPARA